MRWVVAVGLALALGIAGAQEAGQDSTEFADRLFQRGYHEMAAEAYRAYLDEFPEGSQVKTALERLGESEYSLGRHKSALATFDKLLAIGCDDPVRVRVLARRGELLYRLKRYDEAASVLAPLSAKDTPPDIRGPVLYYLGLVHNETGANAEARNTLRTLVNELGDSPYAPYARYRLALIYLALGQLEPAANEFTAVADSAIEDSFRKDSRFRAAETYDKIGYYEAALTAYECLEKDFPNSEYSARAALGLTWALYHAGRYAEASQQAATYLAAHPDSGNDVPMRYLQANSLQQQKQYEPALKIYQDIRASHPDSEFSARALCKIGWNHFLSGKTAEAKTAIRTFLDTYRDSPLRGEAAFLRGSILVSEKKWEEAYEEFRLVAEKYADSEFGAEALYKAGECLAQLDRMDEAGGVFEAFVKKYPENPLAREALLRTANAKFFSASFDEAIAKYEQALSQATDPRAEEETLYNMALTYHNMGKFKESADTFAKVLERFPAGSHTAEAQLRIGDYHLYDADDPVKSMEHHQAALDAAPDGPYAGPAVKALALARYKTNDHDGATELFVRLMKEHPSVALNEAAYAWVGERLVAQERWADAALAFRSLLKAVPSYPNPERVRFRIAECVESEGNAKDAISLYEAVVTAAPGSAAAIEAKYRMARLHEAEGQTDQAFSLYEEVANTNTGETAAQARFRLGELYEAKQDYKAAARNFMLVGIWFLHEELSPEALWRAGQCMEKSEGDALRAYRDVVTEYPDSEQAAKAKARLAELE